jgi:hypothetical protein
MTSIHHRTTQILLALVLVALLAIIAMLATGVRGGPLDPPGTPAPTGKTLEEIPGSWSRMLPANDGPVGGCNSTRFQCVLNFGGVLDRETGLVWEYSPGTNTNTWLQAVAFCQGRGLANRGGWRLPTIDELRSLLDGDASGAPLLSAGHPFTGVVTTDAYWSATTVDSTNVRAQQFSGMSMSTLDKSTLHLTWCVRGGQGYDGR